MAKDGVDRGPELLAAVVDYHRAVGEPFWELYNEVTQKVDRTTSTIAVRFVARGRFGPAEREIEMAGFLRAVDNQLTEIRHVTDMTIFNQLRATHHRTTATRLWQYTVTGQGDGSRVVMRVDIAATGALRWVPLLATPLVDAIMAQRQFCNLKGLVERYGARTTDPGNPETGARDQYQLFHVIYAAGGEAGVPGVENAQQARTWAETDGVLPES